MKIKELLKMNVIFVHGIGLSTFTEKIREIGGGRNFPYPFLRGQTLNILAL